MVIGILGAVGLVIGINQLQNKSTRSEVIPRPRESVRPSPRQSPTLRHNQRNQRESLGQSRRQNRRESLGQSRRQNRRESLGQSRRPRTVKPTIMHQDITKTYEANVAGTKIKSQTVFMELLVKANYNNNFKEFDEYFDFVLKQPNKKVIELFNHRHKDIPNASGSCLSALFIFKNYKYLLKIVNNCDKDILDILVSDGLEKNFPDECLLNFGQLLYLFNIHTKLEDKYKKIKLYSLFFLIKDFESEFNKLFIPYTKNNLFALFPTTDDYIKFEDYKDWYIIRKFDIEIDDPQKSLKEFQLETSDIITNFVYPRHDGPPIWVQDTTRTIPPINIDLENIKKKFSRRKAWMKRAT